MRMAGPVGVRMRMGMGVAVAGADPLDVMMVARLRPADIGLEAEHLGAVLAALAVHRRGALLLHPACAQQDLDVHIDGAVLRGFRVVQVR